MCHSTPKVALISHCMAVMGAQERLLAVTLFRVIKVYGDFTLAGSWPHILLLSCPEKKETSMWTMATQQWLTGPHEVHLGRGECPRLLVLLVPLFIIAAESHRASVAPLLWFISCTPLSLPPLPKSSPVVNENRWIRRLGFLESDLCESAHARERERAKAKAGLFLPEYQPLCLFSPTENTPWFSYCGGAEREREG